MKTIRSLLVLAGLFVAFLALGAAGARGQALNTIQFAGTFTLPFQTQWGRMTLPAGDYSLYYGQVFVGTYAVAVTGKAEGSPRGWILAGPRNDVSATKNALVCVREGGTLIVRALELPTIGESVSFALPRGLNLEANQRNPNGYTQVAGAPVLIQRVPITLSAR